MLQLALRSAGKRHSPVQSLTGAKPFTPDAMCALRFSRHVERCSRHALIAIALELSDVGPKVLAAFS